MIILKEKKSNIFLGKKFKNVNKLDTKQLEKLINEYESELNYEYMECPKCKCNRLIGYGSYERNIGCGKVFKRIRIKRVQCKECGSTHAIIPSFIKPYFQYESSFIDFIMLLINVKKIQKRKIEYKINLSRQLIRRWEKRFKNHEIRLKVTFNSGDLKEIFMRMLDDKFIREYYSQNNLYYFQKVPT